MRKRKFSNTTLSRNANSKCRGASTAAATVGPVASNQPQPLNDFYQSFVLSVVDQAVAASPDAAEFRCPPTSIPTVLQNSHALEESSKSVTSQATQPIPLPPPVPESSLKAAGILAELITLRGTHLNPVDSSKAKKSSFDKFAERSVQEIVTVPLAPPVVSYCLYLLLKNVQKIIPQPSTTKLHKFTAF